MNRLEVKCSVCHIPVPLPTSFISHSPQKNHEEKEEIVPLDSNKIKSSAFVRLVTVERLRNERTHKRGRAE